MIHRWKRVTGILTFCGALAFGNMTASAATVNLSSSAIGGPGFALENYLVTVTAQTAAVNTGTDGAEILMEAEQGESFPLLEQTADGWLKVQVGSEEGYLSADSVSLENAGEDELAAAVETSAASLEADRAERQAQEAAQAASSRRQQVVDYALQFVGCPYRYGGSNPLTGVDCSGFTRYVMQNGAGISLPRSSASQSHVGTAVSAEQMQPGDLIFYGSGRSINHVALYIGNGQIVHASTYKTGVKISDWNYRTPVKIVNVLG